MTLCSAADDKYELGIRVALFSALERLRDTAARVVIFDAGLREPDALQRSLARHRHCAHCEVLCVDGEPFRHFPRQGRYGIAAYLRLVVPSILEGVDRLIYLDADVMVRSDLSLLWNEPMSGAAVGAVRDFGLATLSTGLPYAVDKLGAPPDAPYFNSGVMLIDVSAWRAADFTTRTLDYLRDHGDVTRYADQDALNAVGVGAIHELAPVWNVQVLQMRNPVVPAVASQARAIKRTARIIHFTGVKPWDVDGVKPSVWSISLHLEYARTARMSLPPRTVAQSTIDVLKWCGLFARRVVFAAKRRIATPS
jgi:lipopolysaccharide biosynthesis glycosyltransferase